MKRKTNTVKISKIVILCVCFLFGAIMGKLIYVSLDKEKVGSVPVSTFAKNRNTVTKTIYATRGNIYDSLGDILAQNVNSYTVIAYLASSRTTDLKNPRHVLDKEGTAEKLSEIINMSKEDILNRLNANLYQVELGPGGRNISETVKDKIAALELPGIGFIKGTKRNYKMGNFASYIVGYARSNDDGEIIGQLGLEMTYNEELKGKDGSTTYQKDAYGYQIANTPSYVDEAVSGNDIYLTIDGQIQILAENLVSNLKDTQKYDWFMLSVMDAKTGAILASASDPSFNPNKLDIEVYLNPLTQYQFEPGSTMKIFTFMGAMENGIYDGSKTYKSGSLKVADSTIYDWDTKGFGILTFDQGFNYSSNVAAATLGLELGKTKLKDYLTNAGFGSKTGIEIPESAGTINFNYKTEIATASYGQGITITPLQLLQGMTAVTNNGTIIEPYVVSKIVDSNTGRTIYEHEVTEKNTIASQATVNKMVELLKTSVENGETNAKLFKSSKVSVMGKSGTAQIPSSKGGYLSGKYDYIHSFIGAFPAEDPKYIVYTAVKQLENYYTRVSKPVLKFIEDIAEFNKLTKPKEEEEKETKALTLPTYLNKEVESSKKELTSLELIPIILGDGNTIIKQYPTNKSTVLKGSKVFLLTNGTNYTLPNIIGWTSNELNTYCSLISLNCSTNGYGYVTSASLNEGDVIDLTQPLTVELAK